MWKLNQIINRINFLFFSLKRKYTICQSDTDTQLLFPIYTEFDVVSFDVFDTLIFREGNGQLDVFKEVGKKLNISNFSDLRICAELEARRFNTKISKRTEVSLEDIWSIIEKKTGVQKELGMKLEINIESQNARVNLQLLEMIKTLKMQGKYFVCISDMYLSSKVISGLLQQLGYPKPDLLLVSNEYMCSKHSGELYNILFNRILTKSSIIHLGDNLYTDVFMAKQYGISAIHYKKIIN